MLTAALAALKKERAKQGSNWDNGTDAPQAKIIYTSRTFTQLSQVLKELKKTVYKLDVVMLGSRDQLCVNENISHTSGLALRHECRQLRRNANCRGNRIKWLALPAKRKTRTW